MPTSAVRCKVRTSGTENRTAEDGGRLLETPLLLSPPADPIDPANPETGPEIKRVQNIPVFSITLHEIYVHSLTEVSSSTEEYSGELKTFLSEDLYAL